jgi:hypothetical protein
MRSAATALAAALTLALVGGAWAQDAAAPAPTPEGAAAASSETAPPDLRAKQVVPLMTGSVTGVYYPVGVALCRLVNQHRRDTGLRCAAELSSGSVANIAALRDGSAGLAMVQSDTQAAALNGTGPFETEGAFGGLDAVMALYPEPLTLVARADDGIAGLEDLAGKRVWTGGAGSGTEALAMRVFAALGWSDATFAEVPEIAASAVPRALCDGRIDAFFYVIGQPAQVIQEATTDCDARLVPVTGAAIDEFVASDPSLVATTIAGGLYRGNPNRTDTFGVTATVVTTAGEPEDRIYTIVRSIFGDFEMLRGLDPVLSDLDPEEMVHDGLTAPLHPGAARYYRERGWIE